MTELERMLSGKLYNSSDKTLVEMRKIAAKRIDQFNHSSYEEGKNRKQILHELLGKSGEHLYINQPFYCDYGTNISVGKNFFANYNCVFLDVARITIGDDVMLGPNVSLYTAGHPIDAEVRVSLLEFGYPITIKDRVWIGGNTVINPGVTIGENTIIGSGSVVTKDIPANVIAAGNPCKVIRQITNKDKQYWQALKEAYETEQK